MPCARTDLFLHLPSTGTWFKVLNSTDGFNYVPGGWAMWTIAVSDLDANRRTDVLLVDPVTREYYKAWTPWSHAFFYTSGERR